MPKLSALVRPTSKTYLIEPFDSRFGVFCRSAMLTATVR